MILRTAGYIAFFVASFILCLYLTFPWGAVKQQVLGQASKQLRRQISADTLEPSWLTGVHAEGVEIDLDNGEEPLKIETVDARASLLAFLTGGYGGTVRLPIAQGVLNANVSGTKERVEVDAELKQVELALMPLKPATGLSLGGRLSVDADVEVGLEDPAKSEGQIRINATALETLKGGNAGGFPIPELELGDLGWTLPVENGKVIVRNQRLDGPNVQLSLDGEIVLAKPINRSLVNIMIRFKPTPAFLQKERMLASLLRNIDRFKGSDGYYGYRLSGTLKRVRINGQRG